MLRRISSILLAVVLHAALLALALWMLSRQEPAPEIRIDTGHGSKAAVEAT